MSENHTLIRRVFYLEKLCVQMAESMPREDIWKRESAPPRICPSEGCRLAEAGRQHLPADPAVTLVRLVEAPETREQKAGFDQGRLFYTQGDDGLFQCSEPCHEKTYDNYETVRAMVLSQGWEIGPDNALIRPESEGCLRLYQLRRGRLPEGAGRAGRLH